MTTTISRNYRFTEDERHLVSNTIGFIDDDVNDLWTLNILKNGSIDLEESRIKLINNLFKSYSIYTKRLKRWSSRDEETPTAPSVNELVVNDNKFRDVMIESYEQKLRITKSFLTMLIVPTITDAFPESLEQIKAREDLKNL